MIKPLKVAFSRNWFVFGSLLTICSLFAQAVGAQVTQAVGAQGPNGYYYDKYNGSHYYVRTVGNWVFWFAEDQRGDWAHVFMGALNASRTEFEGQYYDVPKGRSLNTGRLSFRISSSDRSFTPLSGSGNLGGATQASRPSSGLPGDRCVGRQDPTNKKNLTGCWNGDDGGKYYISQLYIPGENEVVVWYGEQSNTNGRPSFANVAIGTQTADYEYKLEWVDVPKGNTSGQGTLYLRVDNANTITRVSETGGFGGSRWTREARYIPSPSPPAPFTCGNTVSDIDGNTYNTVQIGTQCWMKENLRVTKYNDGTNIPLDESGGPGGNAPSQTWSRTTTGARTVYRHDIGNLATYGYLYNWYAAMGNTGGGAAPKKICPTGWHVPTDAEWLTLINFLGGESVAGGQMKSMGNSHWRGRNQANNASGFTALPGGVREQNEGFRQIGVNTLFWSATTYGISSARSRLLYSDISRAHLEIKSMKGGASVRCLRD